MTKRKKFSCDFETTTDPDDCRVWAYGYRELWNSKNVGIGNNMNEFMTWCEKIKADLYFHNLKFDGTFIVNWLLQNGFTHSTDGEPKTFNTIISKMGQWYMIDICYGYKGKRKLHTVIYDSLKKLPFSVDKIGKDFKLDIKKVDVEEEFYKRYRSPNHEITQEEREYILADIEVIAQALEIQFNQGLDKMTNGSDSLHGFKSVISKKRFQKLFPVLSVDLDKDLRRAYKGGFTWLKDNYKEKEVAEGMVFDVNSLYPAMMYYKQLPYGHPIHFSGEYKQDDSYPLWIQRIQCEFEVKEGHIPTIQIKKSKFFKENEYLKDSDGEIVDLYITNVDWELIKDHYHLDNVKFLDGWKFRSKTGIFNEFIDKWMAIKSTSTGAIRLLAKLMLNSLYGKFASNPDVTGKIPYLKDDNTTAFKAGEEETKDPVYTPMGAFITAYAREMSIRTAQKCYDKFIYCDTDSIHITGTEIPDAIKDIIDDNKLGFWAHEGTFKRAKYIRQKTYLHDFGEEGLSVKCAGMPASVKKNVTFENFERGFSSFGKLMHKNVPNGVVLKDTEFTLK